MKKLILMLCLTLALSTGLLATRTSTTTAQVANAASVDMYSSDVSALETDKDSDADARYSTGYFYSSVYMYTNTALGVRVKITITVKLWFEWKSSLLGSSSIEYADINSWTADNNFHDGDQGIQVLFMLTRRDDTHMELVGAAINERGVKSSEAFFKWSLPHNGSPTEEMITNDFYW